MKQPISEALAILEIAAANGEIEVRDVAELLENLLPMFKTEDKGNPAD